VSQWTDPQIWVDSGVSKPEAHKKKGADETVDSLTLDERSISGIL